MRPDSGKTVVISGGTNGMGRATALARLARGDRVVVIGSDEARGRALREAADSPRLDFLRADLSSIAENERIVARLGEEHDALDALLLFANRVNPKRRETVDGLESTFALYYLSRYLLGHRLRPLLDAGRDPLIVNVAGVGNTAGRVHWNDPQLTGSYGQVRAQLQAGRANDLLGVAFAERAEGRARYVLYHPGFTRSGVDGHPNPVVRGALRGLARLFARPVEEAVRPVVRWVDEPPAERLTAVDRGRPVDRSLSTLDPGAAARLAEYTEALLEERRRGVTSRGAASSRRRGPSTGDGRPTRGARPCTPGSTSSPPNSARSSPGTSPAPGGSSPTRRCRRPPRSS
ncbi:NAD(P)-dependent dehydrogenase, short-chain alcohol dehydrogenase family [Streptomyces zhaozhouensis]|uniref:NAD(P)-dependent dehydrogenase, short-chain alcohol dehydrogenase family n=1 Tax=Streptomyces zhaozhouensis TaxID=1300267 RepID=A0A286DSM2_9ACTN|nr:SDR family NAD(P)-dependent oxidoreductase [Streptomyces zhaozhouensis]SOD61640.1 NAD(P)-dependent dehydrogenase, short-chain alcohol dehydrogenase family [Streptomyces zhaozhouensis]